MLRLCLAVLLLAQASSLCASLQNQLKNHPSPYLAMHGTDPVQWQQWGVEALDKAKSENKLLFISSGYFACHWCHVMQRESYRDPQVAALLNRYFIPVKVDRELQPALDEHLIDFVRRTRGSAGWPLNVFLTPEGYPLIGLTYSPTEPFTGLLVKLKDRWAEQSAQLKEAARQASNALQSDRSPSDKSEPPDPEALQRGLVAMALKLGDEMEGGFGNQTRFPLSPQWSVLLDRLHQVPDQRLRLLVELTLKQMASQGMRDHLGGGFFRYTVDPGWQVPHFEKMLYTQAQLARLYLQAARILDRPEYREVARDTLDFTLRVLKGEGGGFIASLSAVDPDNMEGGGYLWRTEHLQSVLDDEELAFAQVRWRLGGQSRQEEGYLPVDATSLEEMAMDDRQALGRLEALEQRVKQKLLLARAPRNHPRDVKQLAAWNGLMLSALAAGTRELKEPRYRQAGARLRDYLVTRLWDGSRLHRAWGPDGSLGSAAMEDYVYVAVGVADWARLTESKSDLELASRLAGDAWDRYYSAGGWQTSDDLLIPGIAKEPAISDGPLPSPAALLIELSLQLDDPEMKAKALGALRLGYGTVRDQPFAYATHIRVLAKTARP